jgi:arginyl-tRNA synthetase
LDIKSQLSALIRAACQSVSPELGALDIVLERPKQTQHGDYACNVAMQAAKQLKRNPRELAQAIVATLPASDLIGKTEIAGAGFINFVVSLTAKQRVVHARPVPAAGGKSRLSLSPATRPARCTWRTGARRRSARALPT